MVTNFFDEQVTFDRYEDLFQYLVKKNQTTPVIVIIDEFSYLMQSDDSILSVLQNIIDHQLLTSTVKLILSGSHISMVEDMLTAQKPLYGRNTFVLPLKPFNYQEAVLFYPHFSLEEKIRFFSVFGGVPFYLARINQKESFADNIINLVLAYGSLLENEIEFFLKQELRKTGNYVKILQTIAQGNTQLNNIAYKSGLNNTGTTVKYITILEKMGLIGKETCFGKRNQKRTLYYIKDQFFNFYFHFIEKNRSAKNILEGKEFYQKFISLQIDEFVSHEFEKIAQTFLSQKYRMSLKEIGRHFGKTKIKKEDKSIEQETEIDLLVLTDQTLSAYECRWQNAKIDLSAVTAFESKIKAMTKFPVDKIGFFSKSGYEQEVLSLNHEFYTLKDLYPEKEPETL